MLMDKLREGAQGRIAKIIFWLIILSFALAGVGSYLNTPVDTSPAEVNGEPITAQALDTAYRNERSRLESQFGENFSQLASNPEYIKQMRKGVLDKLIELHQVPYQGTELEKLGKGEGYCRRQVEGWDARYQKALTPNVPDFAFVRQWLLEHIPADSKTCVIHNDWRFDNVILDPQQPTQVIGVLDWEMATLGDPLMDLGSALAYWIQEDDDALMKSSRRQPTNLKGMLTRQQVVDYYLDKTGLQPENWAFYEVFGLFRLAVIAQQIYYRYYHQQTDNPAFKDFWILIHALHIRALKLIAANNAEAQQLIPEYGAKLQDILKR